MEPSRTIHDALYRALLCILSLLRARRIDIVVTQQGLDVHGSDWDYLSREEIPPFLVVLYHCSIFNNIFPRL